MDKKPIFSIIIPVYNVEKYINQCIESVLNQTFKDFEVLCVDDCGNDNSIERVKKYAKQDNRIKILHHEHNKGLSASRNTALDASIGEYIVCLDSDDWLEENALEILYREFNLRKTNSIWFDAYRFLDNEQRRGKYPVLGNREGYMTITPENINYCSDYTWVKSYKTDSIKKYNLYWPEGLKFEDSEFYWKYYAMNPHTYVIENCLINYRIRERSIVTDAQAGKVKLDDFYDIARNIRKFYIEQNLYQKYKRALLELLTHRITLCKNIKGHYDESLIKSDKLIKDFCFPDEFDEFNYDISPIFSVIVTINNSEIYIEQCLNSILNQTFINLEVLCIDNGSTDNSINIAENFAQSDSRIKVLKSEKNKELGYARNLALNEAKGAFILCVNDKDWINNDCLEEIYNAFINKGVNSVWYKINIIENKNKQTTYKQEFVEFSKIDESYFTLNDNNLLNFPIYSWNKAYNRKSLIKNNLIWTDNNLFEDIEFYFKTFTTFPDIYILDKTLYNYRINEDIIITELIKDNVQKAKDDALSLINSLYNYMNEKNILQIYKNSFFKQINIIISCFKEYPEVQEEIYSYITNNTDISKEDLCQNL